MLHVAYYTVCCVSVAGKAVVSSMACCALNVVHSVSCVACQCARYVFDYVPHRPHLIPVKDDLYRSVVFLSAAFCAFSRHFHPYAAAPAQCNVGGFDRGRVLTCTQQLLLGRLGLASRGPVRIEVAALTAQLCTQVDIGDRIAAT
jgi:hypothetical protein